MAIQFALKDRPKLCARVTGAGGGMNTSDATATAEDIRNGKTAYAGNQMIFGTMPETEIMALANMTPRTSGQSILVSKTIDHDCIFTQGAEISVSIGCKEFGDATAADVAIGKRFTSAAGLCVVGSREEQNGVETSDATATADDIRDGLTAYVNGAKVIGTHQCTGSGLDTNDATATADDLVQDKTAYAGGEMIVGNVQEATEHYSLQGSSAATIGYVTGSGIVDPFFIVTKKQETDVLIRAGTSVAATLDTDLFGDCSEEDVMAGKIFFSGTGKKTGTHVCEGGLDTTDADATAADIAKDKTAYVNLSLIHI